MCNKATNQQLTMNDVRKRKNKNREEQKTKTKTKQLKEKKTVPVAVASHFSRILFFFFFFSHRRDVDCVKVVGGEIFFVNFQDCRSVVIITYYYKLTLDAIVDYAKKLPFLHICVFQFISINCIILYFNNFIFWFISSYTCVVSIVE